MFNMITLVPRGWTANTETTGGNIPPQQLIISQDFWKSAGQPQSIEEFYSNLYAPKKCCCNCKCDHK